MLTTEQIRTLNDARTILKEASAPRTFEGGVASNSYSEAEHAIFQALNVSRCYLDVPVSDDLMHNREKGRARSLGTADEITVASLEDGFELHIDTEQGTFIVNVHGVSEHLLHQINSEIGEWYEEGGRARLEQRHDAEQADAYDLRNPKHPQYHSVHADLYDSREGK